MGRAEFQYFSAILPFVKDTYHIHSNFHGINFHEINTQTAIHNFNFAKTASQEHVNFL